MSARHWWMASLALVGLVAQAQTYNPAPNWKDSYAVGGKCYCDSNGYDHGLDAKTVQTPQGRKNVVEVCGDIKRVLGVGPTQGRVPYNDIQCGNGPANDAPDEAGCPGRVDIGPAGCNQKGPKWDLASVYGGAPPADDELPRAGWKATASSNGENAAKAFDATGATRWSTNINQRTGQFFQLDLGRASSFDNIELNAASDDRDYPRGYRVLVSDDGRAWRGPVASGQGNRALTTIGFSRQTARFVRIEQTGADGFYWWSIADLKLRLTGTTGGSVLNPAGWGLQSSSDPNNRGAVFDGVGSTRWTTEIQQRPGQYFQIDMLRPQRFNKVVLNAGGSPQDYPRAYRVMVSNDGVNWGAPVASGNGSGATTTISFAPRDARYIRIEQTGSDGFYWWSIHELSVFRAD